MLFSHQKNHRFLLLFLVSGIQASASSSEFIKSYALQHENFKKEKKKELESTFRDLISQQDQFFKKSRENFVKQVKGLQAQMSDSSDDQLREKMNDFVEVIEGNHDVYTKGILENYRIEMEKIVALEPEGFSYTLNEILGERGNDFQKIEKSFQDENVRYEQLLSKMLTIAKKRHKQFEEEQTVVTEEFMDMVRHVASLDQYRIKNVYQSKQAPFERGSIASASKVSLPDLYQPVSLSGIRLGFYTAMLSEHDYELNVALREVNDAALLLPFSGNKDGVMQLFTGKKVEPNDTIMVSLPIEHDDDHIPVYVLGGLDKLDTPQKIAEKIHSFRSPLVKGFYLSYTTMILLFDYDTTFSGEVSNQWRNLKEKILPFLFNMFSEGQLKSPNTLLNISENSYLLFTTKKRIKPSVISTRIENLIRSVYRLAEVTEEDRNLIKFLEQLVLRYRRYGVFHDINKPTLQEVHIWNHSFLSLAKNKKDAFPVLPIEEHTQPKLDYTTNLPFIRRYYDPAEQHNNQASSQISDTEEDLHHDESDGSDTKNAQENDDHENIDPKTPIRNRDIDSQTTTQHGSSFQESSSAFSTNQVHESWSTLQEEKSRSSANNQATDIENESDDNTLLFEGENQDTENETKFEWVETVLIFVLVTFASLGLYCYLKYNKAFRPVEKAKKVA